MQSESPKPNEQPETTGTAERRRFPPVALSSKCPYLVCAPGRLRNAVRERQTPLYAA